MIRLDTFARRRFCSDDGYTFRVLFGYLPNCSRGVLRVLLSTNEIEDGRHPEV